MARRRGHFAKWEHDRDAVLRDLDAFFALLRHAEQFTPLLAHAKACGCRISTGVQMYQAQAAMIAGYLIPEKTRV